MTEPRGLLFTASGEPFATGSAEYLDAHPEIREPLPRIYLEFLPEGTDISFVALMDSGGHYCILNADVVNEIGHCLTESFGQTRLRTSYGTYRGDLYIHGITLVAQQGDPLRFDATVFVSPEWEGPCFIGYTGALDRMCSALNPWDNRFYFGPLME